MTYDTHTDDAGSKRTYSSIVADKVTFFFDKRDRAETAEA